MAPAAAREHIQAWWVRAKGWSGRCWRRIRPGPEAARGAVWGTLAAAAVCVVIAGLYLRTGFGYAFDFLFSSLVAAIAIPLAAAIVALLLTLARHLPRKSTGFIVGACAIVMLVWFPPQLGVPVAILAGVVEGLLGASLATLLTGRFAQEARAKKIITLALCILTVAANVFAVWYLHKDGSLEGLVKWRPPTASMPAKLAVADPSRNGPNGVERLFYGTGTDIRRPEYGSTVGLKTRTVDASLFFKDYDGWKRWARKKYWGFDIDKLPLNARVWYPRGTGPFPLVLIVHGNHDMAEFSDPGYAYLGELLASRGFILASIDENFLNSGLFHDPPKQQAVRGWMLLEHLKLWREWNQAAGNPFYGKVDLNRIALMGHSRGGEAAATAAAFNHMRYDPDDANIRFDYNFAIQAVVAIAPADGQYKPAGQHRRIENVSYLTLQGAHDADVSSFMGSRQWDNVRYTQPGPWFKAEIYAYRANHGQFNTVWGRTDTGPPQSWLLNLKPLLPGDEQRRISKTYISAFLEATLKDRREYLPLFQDWRSGRDWLPETVYINRYQDPAYVPLEAFTEDADLTTTTAPGGRVEAQNLSVWKEARIPFRSGDRDYNGVFLGWNRAPKAALPYYSITVPEAMPAGRILQFSVAALDEDAPLPGKKDSDQKDTDEKQDRESPDFTVELTNTEGRVTNTPVSRLISIPPPLTETFTKLPPMESRAYENNWEPVFQTVRVPVQGKLKTVRLKFDRTPMSVICISGIGLSQ